nr:Chain C, 10-mer peptide from Spike protein [Middle East respiratory syndrome-related coronavirus]5GSX_C Chain C, 10-mer peptide from Spike protein [Middle East respiratory syndrome-related coronavirus]5GSX_F Chain F, 10-mer peptide from Spike protein [Middle East respiratory syndrome-related coronavirus]
FYAPEPITSL